MLDVPVHLKSPWRSCRRSLSSLLAAESFAAPVTHWEPFPCTLGRGEHGKQRCRNLSRVPGFPKGCPSCLFARPASHCGFDVSTMSHIVINIYKKDLLFHTFTVITKDVWFSTFPSSCCTYIVRKKPFFLLMKKEERKRCNN